MTSVAPAPYERKSQTNNKQASSSFPVRKSSNADSTASASASAAGEATESMMNTSLTTANVTTTTTAASNNSNNVNNNNSNVNTNTNNTNNSNDALLQAIASKASSAMSQPTVTLTIYIPSTAVGAVIGRRGQNIASLQKTAAMSAHTSQAVRVSIVGQADTADLASSEQYNPLLSTTSSMNNNMNNMNNNMNNNNGSSSSSIPYTYSKLDWSDTAWTPVVVRADPCAALAAAYKLSDMVDGAVDQVVLDVPIVRTKHAAIVGKRGVALATMSADCNVRIMVPNKNTRHDVVQLEGDLDNVKQCLVRVLQIAAKANNSNSQERSNNNNNNNNNNKASNNSNSKQNGGDDDVASASATANTANSNSSNSTSMTVAVPHLPSQTKIRSVGRKTDCTIKKKKTDSSQWQLTVTGTKADQVQAAVAILIKWREDNAVPVTSASSAGCAVGGVGGNYTMNHNNGTNETTTTTTTTGGPDDGTSTMPASPSRRNHNNNRDNRGRGGGGRNNNKGTPKRGKPQNRAVDA
jgi:predicted RNA-binding protein YlqC (UPF0109 family)